ncbi:MAG: hypothetical protein JO197_22980 [Acidobacteria bacterium]|nr:hypothetical protein [Acidobacteriota bacterium]MBV9477928.1 hypothetical protein [Acidobacteriota bacterium]
MRPHFVLLPLLLSLFACKSAPVATNASRPEIVMQAQNTLFFGSGNTAALSVAVGFTNRAKDAIKVNAVRLDPGLMTEYSVYPLERFVNVTLQPGESQAVVLNMTAYTNQRRLMHDEPLSLRATVDYTQGGKRYRERYYDVNVSSR